MAWDQGKLQVLVFSGFLLCSFFSGIALGEDELRDDPIEVLCLAPVHAIPIIDRVLRKEPMFDVTYIPSAHHSGGYGVPLYPEYDSREVLRFLRRYFPRNYGDLTENYEFILLLNYMGPIHWEYFRDKQVEMMRRGIEEGGLGALLSSSNHKWMDVSDMWRERWAGLSLSDTFPNDADARMPGKGFASGLGRFVINEDPSLPPVLTPYRNLTMRGLHSYSTQMGSEIMIPRQGSQTYLWTVFMDAIQEYAYPEPGWVPHILGWRYGEGYTWSLAEAGFDRFFVSREMPEFQREAGTYLYGNDAFFGLVIYGAGRELPLDVVMVHNLRERFGEYADAHSYINSMIGFIEKFEVNINPLLLKADMLQDKWKEGRRLYLAQEWEESRVIMDGLAEDMRLFTEETLAFKDRALLWVYVTEWATVTAAFLASGFLLWTLMVKRKYYKEIDQTRLRPPPGEVGSKYPEYTKRKPYAPWWRRTGEHSRLLAIS